MHDTDDTEVETADHTDDDLLDMPTTAYLVLGLLKVLDEALTAGEIKARAERTLGLFYWSPAVSHIRRELRRLVAVDLVAERHIETGQRSATVYCSTDRGNQIAAQWAAQLTNSPVVIKHPLILKVWMSGGSEAESILPSFDDHLEQLEESIQKALWRMRRASDMGFADSDQLRFPTMVATYTRRALYAELANIRQLRDEIEWRFSDKPSRMDDWTTTPARFRNHTTETEGADNRRAF